MAISMLLKLDGIPGESKIDGHVGEIDIQSYSWGMVQPVNIHAGGGGGAGKVQIQDVTVSKFSDKATHALMLNCSQGTHIKEGEITVLKASGGAPVDYVKVKMKDLLITAVQVGGATGGDLVSEQVSINFSKVKVEYKEQKEDGSPGGTNTYSWDIKANKKD